MYDERDHNNNEGQKENRADGVGTFWTVQCKIWTLFVEICWSSLLKTGKEPLDGENMLSM